MSFTAAFLTAQSKIKLVEWWEATFPDKPLLSRKYAEHMTIKFQPDYGDILSTAMGAIVTIEVIGYAADTRGQAVVVRCRRVHSSNEIPHITMATNGCAPVYSKELVKREWTPVDGPQLFGIVNQDQGRHATHVSASALRLVAAIDVELPYPDSLLTTLHSTNQLHASDRRAEQMLESQSSRRGPTISTHQLHLFVNMHLEELSEELPKVLMTLPPSDINIEFAHTSLPVHRYVLASYSSFLTERIYGTTKALNPVNSLNISELSPVLCQGHDVSGGGGGGGEIDESSSDNDTSPTAGDNEAKSSEESVLTLLLLFYKHELAFESRRQLLESRSVSIEKLLTLLQYAIKWGIQDLVTVLIQMLNSKIERISTMAELLGLENKIKKMKLPIDLETKVSKTVWRYMWKLVGNTRVTQPTSSSSSSSGTQTSNDDSLSLPLDNPVVLEVARHMADLAAIEEDSGTSPEKSLFELEKKLMTHFETLALQEEQRKREKKKKKRENKESGEEDATLPKKGHEVFAINGIELESVVDDIDESYEKAIELIKTMGRPLKITFRDPSLLTLVPSRAYYDIDFEHENLHLTLQETNELPVVWAKLTDDENKCAICLEVMTGSDSDTLITLACDHLFHRDCISKLTTHRPHSYHQSISSLSFRSFKCPLCRDQVELPLGGLLSRAVPSSTRCQTEGCSFVKHSLPLPPHFTASGGNYCCDYCRTSGGHGHGDHCERIVDLPSEEQEENEEQETTSKNGDDTGAYSSSSQAAAQPDATTSQEDADTVAHWVKLFSTILKGREDKKRAKLKLESYGISNMDDSFLRKVTKCLLQNVASSIHAMEATALISQNNFALLFKYIPLCNREELVQVISLSQLLGFGVEHYQKALLLSKPNETRVPAVLLRDHSVLRQAYYPGHHGVSHDWADDSEITNLYINDYDGY